MRLELTTYSMAKITGVTSYPAVDSAVTTQVRARPSFAERDRDGQERTPADPTAASAA